MSKPSSLSRSSSSENLVDSSSLEKHSVDEQLKSPSPPVMKTKKSAQREAYKASTSTNVNSSSSATYTGGNHNIDKSYKNEIDNAQELNAKKEQWEEFSKKIRPDGVLTLRLLMKEKIQDLVEWLKTNPKDKLIELNLGYNSIGAEDSKALAQAFKTNTTISSLVLESNKIGAEGAKALADMLKTNKTITKLDLSRCDIGAEDTKLIVEAIMDNPNSKITTLSLHGNAIGDEGAKDIVATIVGNPNSKITMLYLGGNRIGPDGVKALAQTIKANVTITKLDLGANHIGDDGAKSLAQMLESDKTITTINLRDNRIGNDGAKALAAILKTNTSITTIDITHNRFGDQGIEAIAKALLANPNSKITTLNLWSGLKTSEGKKFFKIIESQCVLNAQRALIENNIAGALDLLTAHPNPNDGNVTSVRDVNDLISKKLFALDKADKLNTDEVKKDPNSVFNKYT